MGATFWGRRESQFNVVGSGGSTTHTPVGSTRMGICGLFLKKPKRGGGGRRLVWEELGRGVGVDVTKIHCMRV